MNPGPRDEAFGGLEIPVGPHPELVRRALRPELCGLVAGMAGYREQSGVPSVQIEHASLVVPLIISFRSAFRISFNPGFSAGEMYVNFVAGLTTGPVWIGSSGEAECIQIDFTPLGACAFLGMPLSELANQLVPADAVLGPAINALREELGATDDWQVRFALVERFLEGRFTHAPAALVATAWRRMVQAGPCLRVDRLAAELDVSRKHLSRRFQHEVGLGPKAVARILRFQRSLEMARAVGPRLNLADIAVANGYADQAHMTRDFRSLGGLPPLALLRQ